MNLPGKIFTVVVAFAMALSQRAAAQNEVQSKVDSLLNVADRTENDTLKIKLLSKASYESNYLSPEKGIEYGIAALKIAERIQWDEGIAIACHPISHNYFRKSDFPMALDYGFRSLNAYEKTDGKRGEARANNNIGNIFSQMGERRKSLEYYLKGIPLVIQIKDTSALGILYCNIGIVYSDLKMYDSSLSFAYKSLDYGLATKDKIAISRCYGNIGSVYTKIEKYDSAFATLERALQMRIELGNNNGLADNYYELGITCLTMANDTPFYLYSDRHIPKSPIACLEKAATYLEKGWEISNRMNFGSLKVDISEQLAEAYAKLGINDKAYNYLKKHITLKDSLYSRETAMKAMRMDAEQKVEIEKRKAEINSLKVTQKRNQNRILGGALAILAIVIIFLINEKRKSDKLSTSLKKSLVQKEILMKEIHHRVKNNLQVISSLLRLQSANLKEEAAKQALGESQNRVLSIALIHQKLYQEENMESVEFSTFANELFKQLTSVFDNKSKNITLKNNIPETFFHIDIAVSLGLILNELFTNTFKYGTTNKSAPLIELNLISDKQAYKLTYADNGSGLPADVNFENSDSLGLKLINRLSKQLNGKAEYTYRNGSIFTINFTTY